MRNRLVALAAVSAFAVGMAGLAVVASRSGGSLQRLPSLSAGSERAADMAMGAPGFGGVDYVIEGVLPELPTEASAFRLAEVNEREAVQRLAEALGIDGPVRKQDGMYLVKDDRRHLTVSTGAGAPWYLSLGCPDAPVSSARDSVSTMGCASTTVTSCTSASSDGPESRTSSASCSVAADAVVGGGSGGGSQPSHGSGSSSGPSGSSVEPCPPCPPNADCACAPTEPDPKGAVPPTKTAPPPGPPPEIPDRPTAERIAREAFGRLGLPLDTFRLDGGEWGWQATVSPAVEGMPVVGFGSSLTIGTKGEITSANGFLGSPRPIGDYPLVGVQGGLDRLRRGSATGPMPLYDGREPAIAPDAKHVVTITGVHLALQQVGDFLVPVYAFEVKGGGDLPVPAVTDRYLEQVRPDQGRPEPVPDPATGSSGSCSGTGAAVGDGGDDANQPLTVEVCVEPDRVKVGQPVTFKLTATDPDAPIVDVCGSPTVAYGDGTPAEDNCGVGCTMSLQTNPPKTKPQRGELTKAYTHAYDKPGTYTAKFAFQSGPCTEWSDSGEATATVVVVG